LLGYGSFIEESLIFDGTMYTVKYCLHTYIILVLD